MARRHRLAWDSSCFLAWANKSESEAPDVLEALDATMEQMIRGKILLVASEVIETEVRPGDMVRTREFHLQLKACTHFETFSESPSIRNLARSLQDRLQQSGRKGGYADLIHVATAIAARAKEFWTTDKKVIGWHSAGVIREVVICQPHVDQGMLGLWDGD